MASDCITPRYLPASFKGVPFEVEGSEDEFGRRGQEYEYPMAEVNGYVDLGRKIRRFNVTGYITSGLHVALTSALVAAAESPGPGMLIHPAYGPQLVACVSLKTSFRYIEEKRITRLDFEFIEATESLAPFVLSAAISTLFSVASYAIAVSRRNARWTNVMVAAAATLRVSQKLAVRVRAARDETSYDAIDLLHRGADNLAAYNTFAGAVDPIENGTATIRRIHVDARERLRAWNGDIIDEIARTRAIEPVALTSRLALVRDYALSAAQAEYATIGEALKDLNFVMLVYDEEELVTNYQCDDDLTAAIRQARAVASTAILSRNIRLPGVTTFDAHGEWPSLVVAQNLYGDGRRFEQLEAYNADRGNAFFMPRTVSGVTL